MVGTTFYFPSGPTATISPAISNLWEISSLAKTKRRKLDRTKVGYTETLTNPAYSDSDVTNQDICYRQYISDFLDAQTIPIQKITFVSFPTQTHSNNNLYTAISIRAVSGNGSTYTGTLLSLTRDDNEPATTATNRSLVATTTAVTLKPKDRLVVEIGMGGDPGTGRSHGGAFNSLGCNSSVGDLVNNDTDTSADLNTWLQFASTNIYYYGETPQSQPSLYNKFKTKIFTSKTKFVYNSGQFGIYSGIRASSINSTTWSIGLISSSATKFYPSGMIRWRWVSGSSFGGV